MDCICIKMPKKNQEPPLTDTEKCSIEWSAQTQRDRITDEYNYYPGINSLDPQIVSKTGSGRVLDRFLEKMGSLSMAQKVRRRRQQKAWNKIQGKLLQDAKEGREQYEADRKASAIVGEAVAEDGESKGPLNNDVLGLSEQEKSEASAEGGQSLLSAAVRSGRKLSANYGNGEGSQTEEGSDDPSH